MGAYEGDNNNNNNNNHQQEDKCRSNYNTSDSARQEQKEEENLAKTLRQVRQQKKKTYDTAIVRTNKPEIEIRDSRQDEKIVRHKKFMILLCILQNEKFKHMLCEDNKTYVDEMVNNQTDERTVLKTWICEEEIRKHNSEKRTETTQKKKVVRKKEKKRASPAKGKKNPLDYENVTKIHKRPTKKTKIKTKNIT